MTRMSLEISDGLAELSRLLAPFTHEAMVLEPSDARALQAVCDLLHVHARRLENEISAKRWNEAARAEREAETRRVVEAVEAPGSNVRLFPVIPRPFHDGLGSGGAA